MKLRVALFAGEVSGDLLGGLLIRALKARFDGLQVAGIGGEQMRAQGMHAWWHINALSMRGYLEVLPHIPRLLWMRRALLNRVLEWHPDICVGIDAPDFNLAVEESLKKAGIPIVHYVSPSFWVWREKRVQALRQSADHVLCLFPFEPQLLAKHGVSATFVGHPLASIIELSPDKKNARGILSIHHEDTLVAILPGSSRVEIAHLANRFLTVACLLKQNRPHLQFVLPATPELKSEIERLAAREVFSPLRDCLHILSGRSHVALAACDVALVASGTATLEAALFKRPMVIAYHLNFFTYWLVKKRIRQPWVGLPNLLCDESIVPELLQDEATPQKLAIAVSDWLDAIETSSNRIIELEQRFASLHLQLKRDSSNIACDVIEKML